MQRLSKSDIYPQLRLLKDVIYFRREEEITGLLDRLINVWSRDFSSSIFIVQALQSAAHLILSTCLSALLNKAEMWTHQAAQEKHFHISHPAWAVIAAQLFTMIGTIQAQKQLFPLQLESNWEQSNPGEQEEFSWLLRMSHMTTGWSSMELWKGFTQCAAFGAAGGSDIQEQKECRIRQSYNNNNVTPNNFISLRGLIHIWQD